ncbi:MAG TPA: hypothetical protein VND93_10025 [Myxococcales bacterium]|nr:hypothetical protein [Myxococcales bacterium]
MPPAPGGAPAPDAGGGVPRDVWEMASQAKQFAEQQKAAQGGKKKKAKAKTIPAPFKGQPQGTPLKSMVPGAALSVSKNGFPVGTTKAVNGMVELPGIGWIQAPTKPGKKGAVNLKIGKNKMLCVEMNKDGSISVKEKKVKGGGIFGKIKQAVGIALAVASVVFPALAPVAIAYNVGMGAYEMSQGNYLGGALQVAGGLAGGAGAIANAATAGSTLANTASTAANIGRAAVAGANAGQAIYQGVKTGNVLGAITGAAGAIGGGVGNIPGIDPGTAGAIANGAKAVQGAVTVAGGIKNGNLAAVGAGLGNTVGAVNDITRLPDAVVTAGKLAPAAGAVADGVKNGDLVEIGKGAKQAADTLGLTSAAEQLLKNKLNIVG